jgi:hypothetical protein
MRPNLDKLTASTAPTVLDILLRNAGLLIRDAAGSIQGLSVALSHGAFGQALAEAEALGIVECSNARNPLIAPLYASNFILYLDIPSADGVHVYSAQVTVNRGAS